MRVALVGGTASNAEAPYRVAGWEIWAPATQLEKVSRVDRVFEIHERAHWLAHTSDHRRVMRLNGSRAPVYMRETHADIPRSIAYPLEEVRARFAPVCPDTPPDFFLSSIDYMLALCALMGPAEVEEVGLWGINMTGRSEYAYQLPSCQYWIGLLRGVGIPVSIHRTSPLCRMRAQYGSAEFSTAAVQQRYTRELAPL